MEDLSKYKYSRLEYQGWYSNSWAGICKPIPGIGWKGL